MDIGRRFLRDSVVGAEATGFDNAQWKVVDLPHDYNIEDLPGPATEDQIGPFLKQSQSGPSTGHVVGGTGTGWYRKRFTRTPDDLNKTDKIRFDWVYMEKAE